MNKYSLIFNIVNKSDHFVSRVTNYYYYLVLVNIYISYTKQLYLNSKYTYIIFMSNQLKIYSSHIGIVEVAPQVHYCILLWALYIYDIPNLTYGLWIRLDA